VTQHVPQELIFHLFHLFLFLSNSTLTIYIPAPSSYSLFCFEILNKLMKTNPSNVGEFRDFHMFFTFFRPHIHLANTVFTLFHLITSFKTSIITQHMTSTTSHSLFLALQTWSNILKTPLE